MSVEKYRGREGGSVVKDLLQNDVLYAAPKSIGNVRDGIVQMIEAGKQDKLGEVINAGNVTLKLSKGWWIDNTRYVTIETKDSPLGSINKTIELSKLPSVLSVVDNYIVQESAKKLADLRIQSAGNEIE